MNRIVFLITTALCSFWTHSYACTSAHFEVIEERYGLNLVTPEHAALNAVRVGQNQLQRLQNTMFVSAGGAENFPTADFLAAIETVTPDWSVATMAVIDDLIAQVQALPVGDNDLMLILGTGIVLSKVKSCLEPSRLYVEDESIPAFDRVEQGLERLQAALTAAIVQRQAQLTALKSTLANWPFAQLVQMRYAYMDGRSMTYDGFAKIGFDEFIERFTYKVDQIQRNQNEQQFIAKEREAIARELAMTEAKIAFAEGKTPWGRPKSKRSDELEVLRNFTVNGVIYQASMTCRTEGATYLRFGVTIDSGHNLRWNGATDEGARVEYSINNGPWRTKYAVKPESLQIGNAGVFTNTFHLVIGDLEAMKANMRDDKTGIDFFKLLGEYQAFHADLSSAMGVKFWEVSELHAARSLRFRIEAIDKTSGQSRQVLLGDFGADAQGIPLFATACGLAQ